MPWRTSKSTVVASEFLKKDFDRGLALVADAILHPAFPEEEVKKAVARRIDALQATKDNPGDADQLVLPQLLLRQPASLWTGTGRSVARRRSSRDAIVDYHKRMYVGRNLIVIVAGDFDPAAAKTRVTETFGAAPGWHGLHLG